MTESEIIAEIARLERLRKHVHAKYEQATRPQVRVRYSMHRTTTIREHFVINALVEYGD